MSRILVTGGAGFIGSHVADALGLEGYDYVVLDNLSVGSWKNIYCAPRAYKHLEVDILDRSLLNSIFETHEIDAVIHLAAQPSIHESWKKADYDAKVNILGTINLLGLCQKYNVRRFVFASTSAVYSPSNCGVYDEISPVRPQTPYGTSKMAAERYIMISGISYAILRLGNVYGPRQVPLGENQLIPRYLSHIFQDKRFVINGDGKQQRDFIYVKDVANAFLKVVESKETGVFNISSGFRRSVIEVLNLINMQLNKPSFEWEHGPAKKGELRNVVLENVLAKHVFNWKPEVGIVEGLRETIAAWPK